VGHLFREYAGRAAVLAAAMGSILASAAFAGTPSLINYQGKLTTPAGAPVADGSYQMRFSLFAASSGGTALWAEPALANPPMSVSVQGGVFTVNLGAVVAIPDSVLANDAWLEVNVNGSVLPRVRLVSAPYALRSKLAEGVAAPLNMSASVLSSILFSGAPNAVINATNTSTSATFPFTLGVAISGTNGEGNWGYLGGSSGAYASHSATGNYGYLGGETYGAYGRRTTSGNYGWLGSSSAGAGGVASSTGAAGYLGNGNYGVYGTDGSSGTHAGYFAGNVTVTGRLSVSDKRGATIPVAAGFINANGTIKSSTGISGCSWVAASNWYEITGTGIDFTNYVAVVTPHVANTARMVSWYVPNGGTLVVQMYNTAGTRVQGEFSFVVYRIN